jgi:hypothetical protein
LRLVQDLTKTSQNTQQRDLIEAYLMGKAGTVVDEFSFSNGKHFAWIDAWLVF